MPKQRGLQGVEPIELICEKKQMIWGSQTKGDEHTVPNSHMLIHTCWRLKIDFIRAFFEPISRMSDLTCKVSYLNWQLVNQKNVCTTKALGKWRDYQSVPKTIPQNLSWSHCDRNVEPQCGYKLLRCHMYRYKKPIFWWPILQLIPSTSPTQQLPKFLKPNLWLVGGFNPSEKYQLSSQIGSFPQFLGWKFQKIFETTTYQHL